MRVSLEWLQDYIELPEPAEDLAETLTLAGTEVERIIDLGVGWDGVVVARILEAAMVAGSDHLRAIQLEVGAEAVQVVSGAPNIAVGDLVPYAPPGTTLPNGMTVSSRKFMQTKSDGMVCSAMELGISSDADGILTLGREGESGVPLTEVMPVDRVLVLETTTNRPDLLCHLGIARELSALYDRPLKDWHGVPGEGGGPSPVSVEIAADDLCWRYQAWCLEAVKVGPSPGWLQRRLRAVGQRPISNAVDAANYAMLEAGQPLHVFDRDRLNGGIIVRRARLGEELLCLDGQARKLEPDFLVIADQERPVALAGLIGGMDSAVSDATTRVVIESASFLGTSIRATSRRLGFRTEASSRFEKQLHPELVPQGARRLVELLQDVAGAGPSSAVAEEYVHPVRNEPIEFPARFVSDVLGDEVPPEEVEGDLRRLGFKVEHVADRLGATAPPYRLDVREPVDLVEEVGRLRGYTSLPSNLPGRRVALARIMAPPDPEWTARDIAVGAGYDEVIPPSFAASDDPAIGLFAATRLRLSNPLASDQDSMRTSVLPGLVRTLVRNADWGNTDVRVFELGRVFWPSGDPLPEEARVLGAAVDLGPTASGERVRAALLEVKGLLELAAWRVAGLTLESVQDELPGLHPGRGARLRIDGRDAGSVGQLSPELASRFEAGIVVLGEVDFEPLAAAGNVPRVTAPSRHPAVLRDLAITVPQLTPARNAIDAILAAREVILRSVELYDEYRGSQVEPGRKGLTFRLAFQAEDRTLRGEEVGAAESRILKSLESQVDAKLR
jgi:phenylalanyl-tRNA synthetase beta chain